MSEPIKQLFDGGIEFFTSKGFLGDLSENDKYKELRDVVAGMFSQDQEGKMAKARETCDIDDFIFDSTKHDGVSTDLKVFTVKPKDVEDKHRPALVYFYGGAFIMMSAESTLPKLAEHAVLMDCTIFAVEYGNAPEVKAPSSMLNCYAATKHILQNYEHFNIDPKRVAIGGESSGGCLTAAVSAELAKRGEGDLIKFAWCDIPAVSNRWATLTEETANYVEKPNIVAHNSCLKMFSADPENYATDAIVFPVLMGNELAAKVPMTFVSTREFCHFRKDAEEYAALLEKNGRLLNDIYIHPGSTHVSNGMPNMVGGK